MVKKLDATRIFQEDRTAQLLEPPLFKELGKRRRSQSVNSSGFDEDEHDEKLRVWLAHPVLRVLCTVLLIRSDRDKSAPLLRGKVHLLLLYLAPLWVPLQVMKARTPTMVIIAIVSVLCGIFNFTASALLHNVHWPTVEKREIARKWDHAGIFVMIFGSALPTLSSIPIALNTKVILIGIQFIAAIFGILLVLQQGISSGHRFTRSMTYVLLGLVHAVGTPQFVFHLERTDALFLVGLVFFYIFGAFCYGLMWPRFSPVVFGHHETFHLCCGLGGVCTLLLNMRMMDKYSAKLVLYEAK